MITFELAVHHPSVVGAAFPVSGWLPPPLWPRAREAGVRYPAIRAMHGDADDLIPIGPTRDAVARLRSLGFAVELHEQRGVGHEITAAMEHELHGWLRAEAGRR